MLYGTRDSGRNIQIGSDDLSGLAHLPVVGTKSGVDGCSGGTRHMALATSDTATSVRRTTTGETGSIMSDLRTSAASITAKAPILNDVIFIFYARECLLTEAES